MDSTEYLTLTQAARLAPGSPHSATIWRWCRRGVKTRDGGRVHLAHCRAGGKLFIKEPDLHAFFRSVAEADQEHFSADLPPTPPKPTTNAQRAKSVEIAQKTISGAGIL